MKNVKRLRHLTLLACGLPLFLSAQNAFAVSLKETSSVRGDKITLGDVFYDLPSNEDLVLGVAPRPGQTMSLNARTLLRIALATDLPWRPASGEDKVVITREATVIEKSQIENQLKQALTEKGITGDFALNIPEQFQKITLPPELPAEFEISKLDIKDENKKFDAVLKIPSAKNPIQTIQITGQIQPLIQVPVVKTNIQNGRTITADDIEMTSVRDIDFTKDTIADMNALIGMTPRRMIVAGRPIRNVDIIAQQIITRGTLVVLSLNAGSLSLTTEAKALENGAKGDVIRVLNTASNQTLQATVIGENQVSVTQNQNSL